MPVKILLNSNQGGYFEFSLCDSNGAPETQACFDRHLLTGLSFKYVFAAKWPVETP